KGRIMVWTAAGQPKNTARSLRFLVFAILFVASYFTGIYLPVARAEGDTTDPQQAVQAIAAPKLESPPNGSYKYTNEFDFTWQEVADPAGGNITYFFQSSQSAAQKDGVLTGEGATLWKSGELTT